jgi:hypothetical protein
VTGVSIRVSTFREKESNMSKRIEIRGTVLSIGVVIALASSLMACASDAREEESGSTASPIVRGDIMTRGRSWIDERVPYSQSRTHKNQYGTYRTDCSGYVSMAWALDESRTTWTLWDVTKQIAAGDLQPGDALLKDSGGTDHVALFVRWAAQGRPVVWEEYSDGHPAEERTWESLRGFTPVRYTGASGTASSSSGKGMPVLVTWNGVPSSEASLDVILTGGRTIGPCVAVDVLRDEFRRKVSNGLGYSFRGECVSPHITPPPEEIVAFQICTAQNDDWARAKCTRSAPWNHASGTVHIDN